MTECKYEEGWADRMKIEIRIEKLELKQEKEKTKDNNLKLASLSGLNPYLLSYRKENEKQN